MKIRRKIINSTKKNKNIEKVQLVRKVRNSIEKENGQWETK